MNAGPTQVNGTKLPTLPKVGDWRPIHSAGNATVWEKEPTAEPKTPAPAAAVVDPVAQAEAEAIRARTAAEADAARAKAREDAERQRIANERAAMKLDREKADHAARVAEANRKREEAERAAAEARTMAEQQAQAAADTAKAVEKADKKWRGWAIGFYALCAAVALPVQISAFWNPDKPWMAGAPVLLEIAALVVAFGTAAAVANRRPCWHFRLITWVLAFIAASVNLWHGLQEFDAATAIGTALASIFGPGVWDLHEHGRIRIRDGKLTRAQRKEQGRAEKRAAKEKAAHEAQQRAEKKAAEESAQQAAEKLAAERAKHFPKVWERAVKLAAALGETAVTEAVWKCAHKDVEGTEPHESVDVIRTRNAAERRAAVARSEAPGNTLSKVSSSQRVIQMNTPSKRSSYKPNPPRRTTGDTPRYHRAARVVAAETKRKANAAKQSARDTSKEA